MKLIIIDRHIINLHFVEHVAYSTEGACIFWADGKTTELDGRQTNQFLRQVREIKPAA